MDRQIVQHIGILRALTREEKSYHALKGQRLIAIVDPLAVIDFHSARAGQGLARYGQLGGQVIERRGDYGKTHTRG